MNEHSTFIHLRAHSSYSLLEGAIKPKELVGLAAKNAMPAIAVTDTGNLFCSLEFSLAAKDAGVQPIVGCLLPFKSEEEGDRPGLRGKDQLLLIAKNDVGYRNLLALCSKAYLEPAGIDMPLLTYGDLEGRSDGLICLTAGMYGAVGKYLLQSRTDAAEQALRSLMEYFPGHLYVELMRHGMEAERQIEPRLITLAMELGLPLVATNDIYFPTEDMYEAHDALLCVADGTYISDNERRRLTPNHRFKTAQDMRALFADIPEAIENTIHIARRCGVMAVGLNPILPTFTSVDGTPLDEEETLRARARSGMQHRLDTLVFTEQMNADEREAVATPYRERLEFELDVIIRMKFPGYFLIVSDFITWSKEQGIPVGPGRGSGAGSLVAWALLITDLDPLRYGLLFERFLNPERVSMPDFDIDFCQDRRDEVIAYVQQRYGKDRVAQIITFGKLQARAVLRDVGRVLQMPYGQVDKICKLVPNNPANPVTLQQAIDIEPALKAAIREEDTVEKLVDIALSLEGLNRHASTHAAGVVIGDRPLEQLVPLYRDTKSEMPVVQYSMKYAETAGLVKFDFLGLKTLSVLQKAVALVKKRDIDIDLLKLPEGDPKTYTMLGLGDTVGVFQLESAGMRDTLRKLKPDTLEDIIALVSLYRPGPMDNIPTYIARKHGKEKPAYLHPKLEEVLKETFGVIIYQEQVMQIAQLLAGYSLGEADLLRRAMGKKIKAEMEAQRDIFVKRSVERGVANEQAKSIFDLIAKFAEYGFNKSHAAAYAVIAYQTAYMKANFPVEFLAASMTYDMHNTDKLSVFRQEAARYGISILPPDVNFSEVEFSVENGAIRYALAALKNVGAQAMQALVEERNKNGIFKDVYDYAGRLDSRVINRRQFEHLIKAGALDSINPNRRHLFETIEYYIGLSNVATQERESNQINLFGDVVEAASPVVHALPTFPDWAPIERLEQEYQAVGSYLSAHPLSGYISMLRRLNVVPSSLFSEKLSSSFSPVKIAGIVMGKKVKVSPKGRFAFLQMSDADGSFEVSIFREELLALHRDLLENGQLLLLGVDAKMEEGGPKLIVTSIAPLDEAVAKVKPAKVRLLLDNANPLAQLKHVLGEVQPKGLKVELRAPVDDTRLVDIDLPGAYALTAASLMQIGAMAGIRSIEEI